MLCQIYILSIVISSLITIICTIVTFYYGLRIYKVGILNYVLNTTEKHFKYDFICILRPLLNDKIIEFVKKNNKELFVYGNYNNNFKYDFPYYIVD